MSDQALDLKGRFASKELDERVQRAVDNFMAGYGCCQSVAKVWWQPFPTFMVSTRRWPNVSPLVLVVALAACA